MFYESVYPNYGLLINFKLYFIWDLHHQSIAGHIKKKMTNIFRKVPLKEIFLPYDMSVYYTAMIFSPCM